jgi:hypothetical protein
MIEEMKRQKTGEETRYRIEHDGTPMTIGVKFDIWVGIDDYGDGIVEYRSRELGTFRCRSHGEARAKMLYAVRERNDPNATHAPIRHKPGEW